MTARRAREELVLTGEIVRRRGSGSFVADDSVRSSFLAIRSIADEVRETGQRYSSRVLRHCTIASTRQIAVALGIARGSPVFHSLITHLADNAEVQLEYRYVRKDAAPGYLEADLTVETPNQYLQRVCPLVEASQDVAAVMPSRRQCELLGIEPTEPCLLLTRVTAGPRGLASFAQIYAPSSRYRLSGRLRFSRKK
jgi:GntR family histidine utilization transcriptional repressor